MVRKTELTENYSSVGSGYYAWWFPGSPIRVHLSLDVIRRLRERLQLAGPQVEREGLLFGKVTEGATEVLDFQPASGHVPGAVAALARDGGQPTLIGYYRTDFGNGLRLTDKDLALAQACFPKPYQVFLLVQPSGFGSPTASFFFHDKDGKMAEVSLLEFPFDPGLLASEERERHRRSQEIAAAVSTVPPAQVSPAPPAPQPVRTRPRSGGWLVIGFLLSALLLFGAGLITNQSVLQAWWASVAASARPNHPNVNPPAAAPTLASLSMGLRAKRENSDVEITWNRESTVIAAATSGVLSVQDGAVQREINLDSTQIRNSSIVYSPVSDQLSIKLAVTTPVNTLIESVMVVMPAKPGAQPIATPASPIREQTQSAWKPLAERTTKPFTPPSSPQPLTKTEMLPPPVAPPVPTHSANLDPLPTMIVQPVLPPPVAPANIETAPANTQSGNMASPASSISAAYRPAEPVRRVVPRLPAELLNMMAKPKTIEVRVTVDKNGHVTKAEGISQSGVNSLTFSKLIAAAREWTFVPARKGNEPIPSEYVLQFHFSQ